MTKVQFSCTFTLPFAPRDETTDQQIHPGTYSYNTITVIVWPNVFMNRPIYKFTHSNGRKSTSPGCIFDRTAVVQIDSIILLILLFRDALESGPAASALRGRLVGGCRV